MTIPISNGDTVRDAGSTNTGIALAIPNRLGQFVAVFDGTYGTYTILFDAYGKCGSYTIVERVDHARDVWDALNVHVRAALVETRHNKKITAIGALHALTGLGLTDAKRAIESFDA